MTFNFRCKDNAFFRTKQIFVTKKRISQRNRLFFIRFSSELLAIALLDDVVERAATRVGHAEQTDDE